ncbi:uncharacterized protein LOC127809259 [Diospyros lotus]|uniref:uncharacterized protein LOC127809259 n=1 Tax=Diospyros lotus TaxID=55363 RepID=UPI002252D2E0|nr:uncharacterized protein LOC127809259 [Diospyros lotus]
MDGDLMNPSQHIERVIHSQTKEESQKNCLGLRASVIAVRLLALQGCAFRSHDESSSSLNCGNFIQMLKVFAQLSMEVDKVVLDNAPKNAQYIAPNIQKDILHIMANRVRQMIREDVGDERFCILVNEAKYESNREQLTIILSDVTTVECHYHFDIFNEAIYFVLMELSTRFNDKSVELLYLSVALDPRNSFESFNSDDICTLAKKFYPEDFNSQDICALEYELKYYVHDVIADQRFQVSHTC